jgi:hypothetical protein
MAPVGANGAADVAAGMGDDPGAAGGAAGAAAGKKGSYVPPALRAGAAGAAGERMGGSKFGERDDFATLRVTNVSTPAGLLFLVMTGRAADFGTNRSQKWQRKASCAICSSALAASRGYSWQRTERRAWPRVSRSSATRTGAMPSRPATRWTVSVSSTLFSGWSLRRKLSRGFLSWFRKKTQVLGTLFRDTDNECNLLMVSSTWCGI